MELSISFVEDCRLIRQKNPVIHNITNFVAMNLSANALLAVGASPIMSSEPEEAEEIVNVSDALVVNIGCLEKSQAEAMAIAAAAACRMKKPWVLDPAGAGISRMRLSTVKKLIEGFHPSLIRGNASEIMAIAGLGNGSHGLDSTFGSEEALAAAVKLAKECGTVIALSGRTDYITDGERIITINNGSPIMSKVTAMGCTASAVCAAFLAVDRDVLAASTTAMALVGLAGEMAASNCSGPGSFTAEFIDRLASINPDEAVKEIRYGEK